MHKLQYKMFYKIKGYLTDLPFFIISYENLRYPKKFVINKFELRYYVITLIKIKHFHTFVAFCP